MIPAYEPCAWYDGEALGKIADSYAEQASILKMLNFDMISVMICQDVKSTFSTICKRQILGYK